MSISVNFGGFFFLFFHTIHRKHVKFRLQNECAQETVK